jgi:hypothetical protein
MIRELAACPNLHIKLGGLGMRMFGFTHHLGELPPSSEELAAARRPYTETRITAFGPERAMFESNFPSTRAVAAMRRGGTRLSASPPAILPARRRGCSLAQLRNSTGWYRSGGVAARGAAYQRSPAVTRSRSER